MNRDVPRENFGIESLALHTSDPHIYFKRMSVAFRRSQLVADDKTMLKHADDQFAQAMQMPAPRVYANGFLQGQSLADVSLVLQTNGATAAIVNMSFTSAKTLAQQLQLLIDGFEAQTGHSIMRMADVASKTGLGFEH